MFIYLHFDESDSNDTEEGVTYFSQGNTFPFKVYKINEIFNLDIIYQIYMWQSMSPIVENTAKCLHRLHVLAPRRVHSQQNYL